MRKFRRFYKVFIDDVVIYSDIYNDYLQHLTNVFSLFQEKNINFNPKKLYIGYLSIELLGFYIDTLRIYSIKHCVRCTNGQAKAQWSAHAMIWYWSMYDSRAKQRGTSDTDWILPNPKESHSKARRQKEYKGSIPIL